METRFVSDIIEEAGFRMYWYSTKARDGVNGVAQKSGKIYELFRKNNEVTAKNIKDDKDITTIRV
jgi:hypothetical protein